MIRRYQRIFSAISIFVLLTLSVIGCGSGSDDSKSTASVSQTPVQTTPTNTPSTTPVPTTPTPESPLVSILINKERSVSEDKRSDSYFLGVKTGCYGNTFSVSIVILMTLRSLIPDHIQEKILLILVFRHFLKTSVYPVSIRSG